VYQVAAPIWNRIAEHGGIASLFAKRLFSLNQDQLNAALANEEVSLQAVGVQSKVAIAFLTMAPLLWEAPAISSFLQDNPFYYDALPEVCGADEAVRYAGREFNLTSSQQAALLELLEPREGIGT
jgi:hypothetical protein